MLQAIKSPVIERAFNNGTKEARTPDPLHAMQDILAPKSTALTGFSGFISIYLGQYLGQKLLSSGFLVGRTA